MEEEEETLRVVSMDSNSVPTTHRGLALTRGPTRIYKSRGTLRKQTTHHAMEAPLRLSEHKAFLRFVHSAPGGGDELYLGRALPGAIKRYVKFWLPLVSHSGHESQGRAPLIPPVDIAWVWHLHRLAPRRYAAYCTERFGRVLDPATAAFKAQTASGADDETRRLWRQHFGDESFLVKWY